MLLSKQSLSKMNHAPSRVMHIEMALFLLILATLSDGTEVDPYHFLSAGVMLNFCHLISFSRQEGQQQKIIKFELH